MIVDLLLNRRLRFSAYESAYGRDYRSFQRDLQQLRAIGTTAGFSLSAIRDREIVELRSSPERAPAGRATSESTLLATFAHALGEPILRELGVQASQAPAPGEFFHVVIPRLAEGSAVADICAELRAACHSPAGRAAVRFRYPVAGTSEAVERHVEPYHVTTRSGAFYLVGFDRDRRDWQTFAIDRFRSQPVRAGTCPATRVVPAAYRSKDVIGFIKGAGPRVAVSVELGARIAASATSRIWQESQVTQRHPDGSATMTFEVGDVEEAIRWALGFGADARVSGPAGAVARAREIARAIAASYAEAAG